MLCLFGNENMVLISSTLIADKTTAAMRNRKHEMEECYGF
jgi:hypothetical protein